MALQVLEGCVLNVNSGLVVRKGLEKVVSEVLDIPYASR
jgi:hypothetical protein